MLAAAAAGQDAEPMMEALAHTQDEELPYLVDYSRRVGQGGFGEVFMRTDGAAGVIKVSWVEAGGCDMSDMFPQPLTLSQLALLLCMFMLGHSRIAAAMQVVGVPIVAPEAGASELAATILKKAGVLSMDTLPKRWAMGPSCEVAWVSGREGCQ
jgi:hypothetical protein